MLIRKLITIQRVRKMNIQQWLAVVGLSVCVATANAAPDEIMVYTDEMNAPGQLGIEQHFNYTFNGTRSAEYPGQMPTNQLSQLTSEIAYGLTNTLEAAVYLPFAVASNGDAVLNGFRLRLKYIAPHQASETFFYGLNVEAGQSSIRVSETRDSMELRPIVGFHDDNWLISFNPIMYIGLDSNVSHQPQFEPSIKIGHRVVEDVNAGVEYYGELGALNALRPVDQWVQTVYAVIDMELHGVDTNFGIGHGFANAVDLWIVKGVVTVPF